MQCYFKRVLDGFIPSDMEIDILDNITQKVDFILSDLDNDDMPEIIVALICKNKRYWAILDRKNFIWMFNYINEQTDDDGVEWTQLLNEIEVEPDFFEANRMGLSASQIFGDNDIAGLALINDEEYPLSIHKIFQNLASTPATLEEPPILPQTGYPVAPLPEIGFPVAPETGYPVSPLPETGYPVAPLPETGFPVAPTPEVSYPVTPNITPNTSTTGMSIISSLRGNVMNSGRIENVILSGVTNRFGANYFYSNITLFIQDGDNLNDYQILLPISQGYNPTLQLVDFSGTTYKDIVVTFQLDTTGTNIAAFIYSFNTGRLRLVFDSRDFNSKYTGTVVYTDYYRVIATMSTGNEFILDISKTSQRILSEIYYSNGILRAPRRGSVQNLSNILFVQNGFEVKKMLVAVQPISGANSSNIIADVATTFSFTQNNLLINEQQVYLRSNM
ncbi:MAG: hypothetical protein BEN19_07710 [Epulopiscium sp. Nuni2H_MBin003]|nr:MAG: hypothetical protein BEN19_07710 [Epulopiscium sp. Nuni2H_MBin003]